MYYSDYSIFANRLILDYVEGQKPSVDLLKQIILLHNNDRIKMQKLFARYSAKVNGAPIRSRLINVDGKPNNKIENNFVKKIVNTKSGYFASKIDYQLDKNEYKIVDPVTGKEAIDPKTKECLVDPTYYQDFDLVQEFLIRSGTKKLDSNVAKMMGICGYGVKNIFLIEGVLYAQNINPWECVFISDTERPKYCLRYYTTVNVTEGALKPNLMIDFYDSQFIHSYIERGDINTGGEFEYLDSVAHSLGDLPMIQFRNNSELSPDCDESVLSLIDAYDVALSDGVNEIDGLAQAYLVLVNMVLGNNDDESKKTLDMIKQTGVIQIGENGKAEFITKNINDTFFENMLKRLEENIYTFASSINMNDAQFAHNTSGVAMKYKLLALETISMISENEFKAASLEMFKVSCNYWALKGSQIDYLDIFLNMKRNFPLDVLNEAQATAQLKGLVSEETRLSQLSFVDDVNYELERMREDAQNEQIPYNLDNTTTTTTVNGVKMTKPPATGQMPQGVSGNQEDLMTSTDVALMDEISAAG